MKGQSAGEMPAAISVVQPVIGIGGQHLRLRTGRSLPGTITKAFQLVSECQIKPALPGGHGIESNTVGVAQPAHVRNDLGELAGFGIKTVKYIDGAARVVSAAVHVSYEDASIRRLGHEAHPLQSLGSDGDIKAFRQIQRKRLAVGEGYRARRELDLCKGRRSSKANQK